MSQLELFDKPVTKKIINNIEYGEVKVEDLMGHRTKSIHTTSYRWLALF